MKVTATTCLGGKRHRWKLAMCQPSVQFGTKGRELKWCKACGCTTEFVQVLRLWSGRKNRSRYVWERCRNEDGSYAVDIPACHKTKAELRKERLAEARHRRQLIDQCEETSD